jgi:hypothetical protein
MRHDSQGTTSPFLLEIKNFLRSYLSHKFLVSPPTTTNKTANKPSTTNISSSLNLPTPQQPQQPPPTRTPVQEVDEYGDTKNPQPARDGQKNLQPTHHTDLTLTHAKPGNNTRQAWQCTPQITSNI